MRRLTPFLALLLALTLAPLAPAPRPQVARAAQEEPPTFVQFAQLPDYGEQETLGGASNDTLETAEAVDDAELLSWSRTISGTIGSAVDLDYYTFSIPRPASVVTITLSGPPLDYDIILGGGLDTSQTTSFADAFQPGLEQVTEIGGKINSIGGKINSIGGKINSIGGKINSIGGKINSIGGTVAAVSANPNTASEAIETQLWLPGEYYLAVTTSNGQFSVEQPYSLNVTVAESNLSPPPPVPEVELRAPVVTAPANQITTLYLYSPARMTTVYNLISDPVLTQLTSGLNRLASTTAQAVVGAPVEKGLVLNLDELRALDGSRSLADDFALWDSNKDNPLYANYIAGLIDNVIEAATTDGISGAGATGGYYLGASPTSLLTPPLPNLRNVVLVGGDEVIPFYRLPDLTTIANEADYAAYLRSVNASGVIDGGTALAAALRTRMLLTDAPYGSGKPYRFYGFPFFVPQLAVGRLVETPQQIATYVDYYGINLPAALQIDATSDGQPGGPKRAFVSGYDFLKDQAGAVGAALRSAGLQTDEINVLVNDTWGSADVEQQWFDGVLSTEFPAAGTVNNTANIDLSSVNAHFDHWRLLPANNPTGGAGPTFEARRLFTPNYGGAQFPNLYFGGTLGYSVGCHSGYSATDGAIATQAGPLYQVDFAQAFNTHGGNWVGNTGYGYGTADGVDYSERLAVLYTQELTRQTIGGASGVGGASIGEALVKAKQRYVRNAASLSAYDYKAVNIMTLYGLPYARVQVTSPQAPAESSAAGSNAPPIPTNLGRLTRTITLTINVDASDFKSVPRTGSTLFDLDPADFTVVDEFDQRDGAGNVFRQQVRTFSNSQVGAPTLPTFAYDISARNSVGSGRLRVIDVVFVSGIYSGTAGFNPQVTQVTTETLTTTPITSRADEPNFAAGAGFWFPEKFFGYSSVGEGADQRDQLTAFAAQFRADAGGVTGLLRPYRQMVFKVIYDDPSDTSPAANALDADTEAPTITSVRIVSSGTGVNTAQSGQSVVIVNVAGVDDEGPNPGQAEVSGVFLQGNTTWVPIKFTKTAAGVYRSEVLGSKTTAARFIVRATDKAGNTTYYTGKGQFTPLSVVALPAVVR